MKVKYSVIPFIPAAIAMVALKVMSLYSVDSNGMLFGMNKTQLSYLVIGIGLGLFVLCVLINIFDRKTAPVYRVRKNYFAGIFAIVSGLAVAASSFVTLINTMPGNTDDYLMKLIVAVLSIPAAIALIIMSKVHFSGKSVLSGISMLFIFPALWGCSGLVSEFLSATKVSISASDMTPLFCYIFVTLYLFYHAMIISRIKGRNPCKACFIYGLPSAALSLAYGVYVLLTASLENSGIGQILVGAQFIALALYTVSFVVEMFFGTLTKDEIEIIDSLPDEEDTYANSYISSGGYDELLISHRGTGNAQSPEERVAPNLSGLDDFVMGYNDSDESSKVIYADKKPAVKAAPKSDSKKDAELVQDIKADEPVPVAESAAEVKPEPPSKEEKSNSPKIEEPAAQPVSEPKNSIELSSDLSTDDIITRDRMSEIDRLLQELEDKK